MEIILTAISIVLSLFQFVLLARVLLTWLPNLDHSNQFVRILYDITEPVLRPVRDLLPPQNGVDFSPLVVMLGIFFLQRFLPI